jgi:hypothetical protein
MSAVYPNWSSSTTYPAGASVSYIGIIYRALQTTRGNVPTTLAPNWAVNSPTPGGSVSAVSAGNAITITGSASNPVVNNNGVVALTAGAGIALVSNSATTGVAYEVDNTGVLALTAGTNVSITGTKSNYTINASGGSTIAPSQTIQILPGYAGQTTLGLQLIPAGTFSPAPARNPAVSPNVWDNTPSANSYVIGGPGILGLAPAGVDTIIQVCFSDAVAYASGGNYYTPPLKNNRSPVVPGGRVWLVNPSTLDCVVYFFYQSNTHPSGAGTWNTPYFWSYAPTGPTSIGVGSVVGGLTLKAGSIQPLLIQQDYSGSIIPYSLTTPSYSLISGVCPPV